MCAGCEGVTQEEYDRILTPKSSYAAYPMKFWDDSNGVQDIREILASNQVEYDTLVGTGMSGALVVPRLAECLGKDWAIVRKTEEKSHRERNIEGTRFGNRWLFVDDFQQYGGTEQRVVKAVNDFLKDRDLPSTYVGCFWYADRQFESRPKPYLVELESLDSRL